MSHSFEELMKLDIEDISHEELKEALIEMDVVSQNLNRTLWNFYDIMTEDQKKRWENILENERKQLEELELKYS